MMLTKNQKIALALITTGLASAALFAIPQATSVDTGMPKTTTPPSPPTMGTPTTTVQTTAPIDMKKVSEAFGHFIGRHLNSPGVNFDLESVIKGLRDGSEGKPAPMTDKEYELAMTQVQKNAFEKVSQNNLKDARDFMLSNANAPGVVEVKPEKLQYRILKQGTGPVVESTSTPQINYTGRFLDGTVFGSSEDGGGPVTVPLSQTIPGFSLGIAGMKEGETRRLFIHPDLGYGTTGHLPPNSLLIFDIEVLKANSPDKTGSDPDDEEDLDGLGPLALADDDKDDEDDFDDGYDDDDELGDDELDDEQDDD